MPDLSVSVGDPPRRRHLGRAADLPAGVHQVIGEPGDPPRPSAYSAQPERGRRTWAVRALDTGPDQTPAHDHVTVGPERDMP